MLGKEILLVSAKKVISGNFILSTYGSTYIRFQDADRDEHILLPEDMEQGYTVVFPVTILHPEAPDINIEDINTFNTCNYTVNARDQIVITPIGGKVRIEIGTPW